MIFDRLSNASSYRGLGPRFVAAFDWLGSRDLTKVAVGRHDIRGAEVFALVQENATKPPEGGMWEAHRQYADVQCVVSGRERMGYQELAGIAVEQPYDEKNDCVLGKASGTFFEVPPGYFVVFLPQDAHMPNTAAGEPGTVRKVVVKVKLD